MHPAIGGQGEEIEKEFATTGYMDAATPYPAQEADQEGLTGIEGAIEIVATPPGVIDNGPAQGKLQGCQQYQHCQPPLMHRNQPSAKALPKLAELR